MKRITALILALIMIFSFCGCKKDSSTSEEVIVIEDQTTSTGSENISSENQSQSQPDDVSSQPQTPESNSSENIQSTTSNDDTSKENILIDYNTVVEVDLCDDVIRGYLDATDPTRQYQFLKEFDTMVLDHQNLSLTWKPDGSQNYTLYISENADFSNAHVSKISGQYNNGNITSSKVGTICYPGKTYYWKVLGQYNDVARGGGKIHIKDQPVRWIKLDGVNNVRDMGGWSTTSGKTIKYGKIYRGSKLDGITQLGIDTIKQLGIKTDIDIRSTASWDSHGAVDSTGLEYHFIDTGLTYDYIFARDGTAAEEVRKNYPKIFELLADESNYPIYLHCNYGNDRTGTMAFILNGLLGVTYEDLTRDFEITSYAYAHDRRWRGDGNGGTFAPDDLIQHNISNDGHADGRWGVLNKVFMESNYCTDGKLATAIEGFLLEAGVKQEHIDAYKRIMLG